jgi:hypothetical protein
VQGREWTKATFHPSFGPSGALVSNGTTARCSNCHLNLKPGSGYTPQDHSPFTATSAQDCSSCHSWPGTGTASAANWLGAGAEPQYILVGGFTIPSPPAATAGTTQAGIANLPHPSTAGVACTDCHTSSSGGKPAIGYDHASALINDNCASCHEAGTSLVQSTWNGATAQASGAGSSRPFTLTELSPSICNTTISDSTTNVLQYHYFGFECSLCHTAPGGIATATTGSAYTAAWKGHHPPKTGSTSSQPCAVCHQHGCN